MLRQQIDMQGLAAKHGAILQAWSPLAQGDREVLTDPTLGRHRRPLARA
ncbi:hypothetical protein [Micromonospora ureilytica]